MLLNEKVRPLRVEKRNNFLVYVRRTIPDEEFGKWQPITRWGYLVVCPSYKEAIDLMMLVGGRVYPAPQHLALNDSQYTRWLMRNHFKIEPNYNVTGRKEMMFAEWIRGWVPESDQIIRGEASPLIVHRCLDESRTRSPNADMIESMLAMEPPKL